MARTAEIEVRDLNSAQVLGGFQIDNGPEWHLSGVHYSGVIIAFDQQGLCQHVAREVFGLKRWSLHVHTSRDNKQRGGRQYTADDVYPDEMNCAVIDGEYLGFAEWLRRVIPKYSPEIPAVTLDGTGAPMLDLS